jgi:hypothetical protein
MSAIELPDKVKAAINAHIMAAASSNAFTAGVIGAGKPLAVVQGQPKDQEKPNPKPSMRSGPTLGPRKAAKVSDIF